MNSVLHSPAPLQTPPPISLNPDTLFGPSGVLAPGAESNAHAVSASPNASLMQRISSEHGGMSCASTVINLPTPAPSPQPDIGRLMARSDSNHFDQWGRSASPVSPTGHDPVDFGERFIDSVVAHYPRLDLPQRRRLFTALLPFLQGEDFLHLSQLISPYLRRDFLAELPAEISLHILSFVDDPKDLVRASRVSRTWRGLVSDEQTWKVMFHRYKGRGWAESAIRPPIERIRMKHPEARFGAIGNMPALSGGGGRIYPTDQPSHIALPQWLPSTGSPIRPAGLLRRTSTLSPTAQPFTYPRPNISANITSALSGPSTSLLPISSSGEASEAEVDRFLEENQTPLAERRRRTKGKGKGKARASEPEDVSQAEGNAAASGSGSSTSIRPADSALPWQMQGLGFAANRLSHPTAFSPSAPLPRPLGSAILPPPPQDLHAHLQNLSINPAYNQSTSADSSSNSPSARFANTNYSPAVPLSAKSTYMPSYTLPTANASASGASRPEDVNPPSYPSLSTRRNPTYTLPVPRPRRYIARRSMNPFGVAITTSAIAQQHEGYDEAEASSQPFSYKTQFKKAYLTESNWLKGPGRTLCTQTSQDDSVVTSLGFDNDWIVVGMATNHVHVFDAHTGEYAKNLHGHTAGVWCLVLVSKGGERLDKDGRRLRPRREPSAAGDGNSTKSDDSQSQTMQDTATEYTSEHIQRSRSVSARPPDVEKFFGIASDASSPIPPAHGLEDASSNVESAAGQSQRASSTPLISPERPQQSEQAASTRMNRHRRPSSFCGVPSSLGTGSGHQKRASGSTSGFPFGSSDRTSSQQASACGTAAGWGQKGAVAVTAGCDRDIRVWDVESGRCMHVMRGHMSTVRCLKVLDGRPIAVSGSRDATLRVWDIEQGVQLRVLARHQHSVRCIEISGNIVVSGSYDTTCRIWNVDTGECLHLLEGHQHQIYAVAFDGVRVASGSLDSTVRIWSAKTGECLALLQGHTSLVGQLQLTDSVLVTGGSDGRVIVFSLSTFECLHRLCAHDNSVTCLQFNDRFMVTGGNDGRVKLWDRPSGRLIRELAEPCEAVWRVTFREDKCVLLCKRGGRTVMDVRTFAPHDDEL